MLDAVEHRDSLGDTVFACIGRVRTEGPAVAAANNSTRRRSITNDLVQTDVRRSLLGPSLSSLAVAGSLLTAMAATGAAGNGGSPRGPERSEGAAKRLDAPFPAARAASHMY